MKAIKWLDAHFEETLLVILLVVIACVELAQVIIRRLSFIPSLTWAEELCRFLWIWSVFLSLPYTIRKCSMLRVTVIPDLFPHPVRMRIDLFADAVVLAAMVFCAVYSVKVVSGIVKSGETSPAMLWPMWVVYSVMLLGFALGAVRGLQQFLLHLRQLLRDRKGGNA